jgi:integrase
MGRREMLFLRDHAYGGGTYYRNWSMTFWRGFMKFCGNHIFDELDFRMTKCPRKSVRWLSEENDDRLWEFILNEASPIQAVVLTQENGLGLRWIELERLTLQDIQNGRIHVLGKGRNGGKWRTLTLDKISAHAIEVWMDGSGARLISGIMTELN